MGYKIFLDDERMPARKGSEGWVIARSYEEFVQIVSQRGTPDFVSFDHDLGADENGQTRKTGYDCAHWLVSMAKLLPDFAVHSQNPVGAKNIKCLLENYRKFRENPLDF